MTKVKWRREETENDENIDWFRAKLDMNNQTSMESPVDQILTIFNISRSDAGVYTCYTLGENEANFSSYYV